MCATHDVPSAAGGDDEGSGGRAEHGAHWRREGDPGDAAQPVVEVRAASPRALPAAQTAARRLGIPRAYGSYEALIADPDIEAIYNPLPNHLHVPLTLAAAAGKHVLCEKPIALSADEGAHAARGRRPAHRRPFMVRHHPQWQRVRELLRSGRIGTPRIVQAFSYFNDDPANIRNQVPISRAPVRSTTSAATPS